MGKSPSPLTESWRTHFCRLGAGTHWGVTDSLCRGWKWGPLTELSKDEAHREAIRRWHNLPQGERQTHMHAQVFAAGLVDELDFRTMGHRRRVIEAWLVEDMEFDAPTARS